MPAKIYVSGNPIALRGFNGEYALVTNRRTGAPEYHQAAHYLTIGIGPLSTRIFIRPTKIIRGVFCQNWLLCTNDSGFESSLTELCPHTYENSSRLDLPFGNWGSIMVTPTEDIGTWWRSNRYFVYICILVVLFGLILLNVIMA